MINLSMIALDLITDSMEEWKRDAPNRDYTIIATIREGNYVTTIKVNREVLPDFEITVKGDVTKIEEDSNIGYAIMIALQKLMNEGDHVNTLFGLFLNDAD